MYWHSLLTVNSLHVLFHSVEYTPCEWLDNHKRPFACLFPHTSLSSKIPDIFMVILSLKHFKKCLSYDSMSRTFVSAGESSSTNLDLKQRLRLQTLSVLCFRPQRRLLYYIYSKYSITLPFLRNMNILPSPAWLSGLSAGL